MLVAPNIVLTILLTLTAIAVTTSAIRSARRREAIRSLAARWRMNFGRADSFRLTARVAQHFPIPGAAAVRVADVVYGLQGDAYRYVFTAHYTLGVTGPKTRHTRVATFAEPRDRRRGGPPVLTLGSAGLTLLEQYESLAPTGDAEDADAPQDC